MSSTSLILTVGTGTAGPHSNLVLGLRRTLELIAPERFWLIPSAAPDSIATADLVREGREGFQPWAGDRAYRSIARPDSLDDCRAAVREVIAAARRGLPRGESLVVNPTSGTKQMSAGATLAALDEGVGEIVFTVGERADGVVKTGTEKLESFDPAAFFAERDLANAVGLVRAGAFAAAAQLLRGHESLKHHGDVADCLHEWDRLNYEAARQIAARSSSGVLSPLRNHLTELSAAVRPDQPPSMLIAADILDNASLHEQRGDTETALVLACKAAEMGLRFALWSQTGLTDPYDLATLGTLPVPQAMKVRFETTSLDKRTTVLGLRQVAEILRFLGDPLAEAWFGSKDLQVSVRIRNDLTHKVRAVSPAEARTAVQAVQQFIKRLPLPPLPPRPSTL